MAGDTPTAGHRVFVSYAHEDGPAAREIGLALEARGLNVWLDAWQVQPGESAAAQIRNAVEATDTFVAVLSSAGARSGSVWVEVAAALDRRGIDVVLVVFPHVDLPAGLDRWQVVEYTGATAAQRLADRIEFAAALDLTQLQPDRFEALVVELLQRYGYAITSDSAQTDAGYDLRAELPGMESPDDFIVQVKAYRSSRVSVSDIQRLSELVRRRGAVRGLLVTSGQLTSVARRTLEHANEDGVPLQVMEGPVLRRMLIENPDIGRRYATTRESGAQQ
jgi:TIR domain/Restriction endonuclease